jgi:CBS-domain-containing membrane protein
MPCRIDPVPFAKGLSAMSTPVIYQTDFPGLKDADTVGAALRRMLDDRVYDLPVVDAKGRLIGMFKLDRVYATLLPKAALIGYGMPDLAFLSDTLGQLREKMREIEHRPVREFVVKPAHVVHPDTSPLEIVMLLHQGASNIPVLDRDDARLLGMVSARDLLTALLPGEGQ